MYLDLKLSLDTFILVSSSMERESTIFPKRMTIEQVFPKSLHGNVVASKLEVYPARYNGNPFRTILRK